ncbi:hypothetical protein M1M27_gp26 [Cellulophaga phage Ingeline_1]|uniref:Uncharacterized protein n=1 Tax=Cellulophaga phage Ingeline_1 TaxID=2745674 RepID=A0A8E4ZE52_9CAUD|nr:hypothetical protein M1M27_gp26 [Cellulophaga phage Ingeline_1]QQV90012.1 hypothetical protein Ingeline2_25 [Cellulophaga phage Ingeline_2]QQV90062.1 hypothetical protein Ingeline3_25 [Cellulophaga phage Ingeline_3]QQV90112.1 hypothetical protein Ingeline4_25 [Cellulophaga phage Ingeline_4]QQV90162.1 hypothetical protein Ingeline5_25 [Cellulophaga phage Ingeline_5]QQV90211.1 hypothetical protein Ingeline6_25 [Cellulophaga phage Ingeline_6]QQV90261.1 hypothetical protein Ingeline7_25 [Cellu
MDKDKIIKMINSYWKFDDDQQPLSSWHDKQDLISAIEKLSIPLTSVRLSLPDEDEINSMQLEMDCPTPNEEEYTTSGFKSGVRWLKNAIERQMLKGNES